MQTESIKWDGRNKCKYMGDISFWMLIETTRENEISPRESMYIEKRRGPTTEFRETKRWKVGIEEDKSTSENGKEPLEK